MKIIGWIFILVGISGLVSHPQLVKINELAASVIFVMWGVLSIAYKKYLMKDDVYIGTRYLDGGFLFYGMFLFGLSIFGCSLILENGLSETGEDVIANEILLLLLFFGGSLLTFKGYKKYHANKKIDSQNPVEGFSRDKYE